MTQNEETSPTTPSKLYRFRPPRKREIDALGKAQVYFSARSKMRDPFEGLPELLAPSEEEIRNYLVAREAPIARGDKKAQAALRRKIKRRLDSDTFLDKAYREATDGIGICALSSNLMEPLLWAQRADRHRGFCLEFDCKDPRSMPIGPAFKMLYSDERPRIAPLQLEGQPRDELLRLGFRYKPAHWDFEKEWRLFSSEGAGKRTFQRRLLSAVYLGGAATPQTRKAILRKLSTWSEADRPEVFSMSLRNQGFELEAIPIEMD